MLKPLPAGDWSFATAAHLLNRAGFGGPTADIQHLVELGPERAVSSLVDYENFAREVMELSTQLRPPIACWNLTRSLGQDLFAPPNVRGWDGGVAWITTNNLIAQVSSDEILDIAMLEHWLKTKSEPILGRSFEPLSLM